MLVIEALGILKRKGINLKVLATGKIEDYRDEGYFDRLMQRAKDLGVENNFKVLGVVSLKELRSLMLNSIALLNPSFFEGWSTTVEEAKALGVPLLLSDISVHREQCSAHSADFFNPNNSDELVQCMKKLLNTQNTLLDKSRLLVTAIEAHRLQMIAFARTYQNIVQNVLTMNKVGERE
jgi:glycosyltransferase involved in cell wall biosynthesis